MRLRINTEGGGESKRKDGRGRRQLDNAEYFITLTFYPVSLGLSNPQILGEQNMKEYPSP